MIRRVRRCLDIAATKAKSIRDQKQHRSYIDGGRLPWTPGYHVEKTRVISEATSNLQWDPDSLPEGHGFRLDERVVEYPWFFSKLANGPGQILDAGSVLNFEYLVDNPKLAEKTLSITTLGPESHAFWQKSINYVFGDLRNTCFRDAHFDWICCLSTLEHIGLDNTHFVPGDMSKLETNPESCLQAIDEFQRILKPGGRLYLTVPFGKAQNHKWFQIFDSQMIDELIGHFAPSHVVENVYQYLPDGWCASDRNAAQDATYFDIKTQKDYEPDYAAASRAVICLEMTK